VFKAGSTVWGENGASSSLQKFAPNLQINPQDLESRFARPETKRREAVVEKAKVKRVSLLDPKRAIFIGFVMNKIRVVLQGKELREALFEVDDDILTPETLRMVMGIIPTREEVRVLNEFRGDEALLDRPEQLLRSIAHVQRLEARLQAMIFRAHLTQDLDIQYLKPVDDLKRGCIKLRESAEFQALMQVVLNVGNELNAGTNKGKAVGFKVSSLVKLSELKAADNQTTLLHYIVEVIHANAAPIIDGVLELLPHISAAARVEIEELRLKDDEIVKGLAQVDNELMLVAEADEKEKDLRKSVEADHGAPHPPAAEEDQFSEVLTNFYMWASAHHEEFTNDFKDAQKLFLDLCAFLGEDSISEPRELFEPLANFLVRLDGINNALLADAAKRRVQKKVSAPQLPQAASKKAQRFQKTRSAPLGSLGNDSAPGSGGAARGSSRDKVASNHQQFVSVMEKSSKLR